jgi:sugar phosphate isomerase/epimerase
MLLRHPAHEGRSVRLSYCLNLHPADTLAGLYGGLERVTEPLHARLAPGREFSVGMYLPASLARELASNAEALRELRAWLDGHGLDPSTFNAFPYGGFAHIGLKEGVFAPEWWSAERLQYTLDVAQVAARLLPALGPRRHVSISTHTGAHASRVLPIELDSTRRVVFANWVAVASQLARIEREQGTRIVLSAEPEPRSLTETCAALADAFARERELRGAQSEAQLAVARHVGVCLDTCHAAVEFEPTDERWRAALAASGAGVGKLQFTSALSVLDPQGNEFGRRALLELDEARYLHQVTGQGPDAVARAGDLAELRSGWAEPQSAWHACTEWRCHFHVPVDLDALGASGLATTRDYADAVLALQIAAPELWPSDELHVEIETYTWDVLPREARGAGELVDGLEREYRHVLAALAAAGWLPA